PGGVVVDSAVQEPEGGPGPGGVLRPAAREEEPDLLAAAHGRGADGQVHGAGRDGRLGDDLRAGSGPGGGTFQGRAGDERDEQREDRRDRKSVVWERVEIEVGGGASRARRDA